MRNSIIEPVNHEPWIISNLTKSHPRLGIPHRNAIAKCRVTKEKEEELDVLRQTRRGPWHVS